MSRRKILLLLPVIAMIAALVPVGVSFADTTAADCADGTWEVRPNQTLYFIAFTCGVTVDGLVALNQIENPNLIFTGQILQIPGDGFVPAQPPSGPAAPPPPPPPSGSGNGVAVSIAQPLYSGDGRVATVNISVTNLSVTPMLAGGRYYPNRGRDYPDGPQWVTLLGAVHAENPYPAVLNNEPLWHATVYTSDGHVFPAYAGCIYEESIFAMGDEPLSRDDDIWFHWEVTLDGGWFDCGNAYQVKPEDMLPGQGGSAPLTVYLIHPRRWNAVPTVNVRINRIDLELFDTTGRSLGIVASQTFQ